MAASAERCAARATRPAVSVPHHAEPPEYQLGSPRTLQPSRSPHTGDTFPIDGGPWHLAEMVRYGASLRHPEGHRGSIYSAFFGALQMGTRWGDMVLLTALLPGTARPDLAWPLEICVGWQAAAQPGHAGWEVVVVPGGRGSL